MPVPGANWESETFSAAATAELQRLAESLKKLPGIPVRGMPPLGHTTVIDDTLVRVDRVTMSRKRLTLPPKDILRSMRTTIGQLERSKFKLFKVDYQNPQTPVTWQYLTVAGPYATLKPSGYLEKHMTWRIEWRWDPEAQTPPQVTAMTLEDMEEVWLKTGSGRPQFTDATEDVIGASDAYREQLSRGTDYWRQRIEVFNRFFKFGHQGLAIGDANGDGLDDVYVCQNGGLPNRLFLQRPDGTAKEVASESGVDLLDLTRSALFIDLDNDGDQDLVLAADTGLLAFQNDGRGRFDPKLRYPKVRNAFSLTAVDYDNDSDLDLYVCRYFANQEEGAGLAVPVPYFDANNGGGNFLIRNDGPAANPGNWLDFSDATQASGLDTQNNRRFSFAAVWEDIDLDGDQDLFVANDFGQKNLYLNHRGAFKDIALSAGINDGGFGMAACSGDFDGDGRPDLYAGNMFSAAGSRITRQPQFRPGIASGTLARFQHMARGNSLFRNLGQARFQDVSETAGVTLGRWSWGSLFGDLDNDGWEDLFVANGYVTGKVPDDL